MLWSVPGKCLRRHASRRGRSAKIWSLPSHSGAGVCRSEWTLVAIVRGKCSARAITLWASRLDDPNQDCVLVWGTITKDQQAPRSATTDTRQARASSRWWVESEGPQQSIPDTGQGWPADDASSDRQAGGHAAVSVYICVSKHDLFTWSGRLFCAVPPASAGSDAQVGEWPCGSLMH